VERTSTRRAVAAGFAALALAVAGCSAGADGGVGDPGSASDLSGTLDGGGSSAQQAAQEAWAVGFQSANAGVTVDYDPVGSGDGRGRFVSGEFAFAGSDAYLTDEEGELSEAKERCGGHPIEIPDYLSPIAIIAHVDGLDDLNLSPGTLAGIFSGRITRWNDPLIAQDNPEVTLPSATITPVHRSDESDTTKGLTDYLDAVATNAWGGGVTDTWPSGFGGEDAAGTSGVVSVVKNGENTVGYADASQAGDLVVANIKVGSDYVAPSAEAAGTFLEVSPRVEDRPHVDMAFDLDHNTAESGVYPITLASYLLACRSYNSKGTANLVKAYLTYILSDEGQQQASDGAGPAPLPASLLEEAKRVVQRISMG
jgi:phosphate transport system substrate-binding protein